MKLTTEVEIRDALKKVANLVVFDEAYLPIFERLESELEACVARNSSLHRATTLANQNANGFKSFAA
ncbi:hypothetical protein [Ascidiaceihabitans sp.]|uniref:hypothetical protein n=1 Tax=Ascidiaceihabitans sp. TaxID=1872644 RepID=UPI00329793FC